MTYDEHVIGQNALALGQDRLEAIHLRTVIRSTEYRGFDQFSLMGSKFDAMHWFRLVHCEFGTSWVRSTCQVSTGILYIPFGCSECLLAPTLTMIHCTYLPGTESLRKGKVHSLHMNASDVSVSRHSRLLVHPGRHRPCFVPSSSAQQIRSHMPCAIAEPRFANDMTNSLPHGQVATF